MLEQTLREIQLALGTFSRRENNMNINFFSVPLLIGGAHGPSDTDRVSSLARLSLGNSDS